MKIPLLAIAVSLSGALASAQVAEFGVHGGVSRFSGREIGSFAESTAPGSPTTSYKVDDGWRMGFRVTLNNWRFFGHEFGYAYNRTKLTADTAGETVLDQGTAMHQGFYNFLVYGTPEGSIVRPFAAGGGHFSNFAYPGYSALEGGGSNKIGFNYGGGVKVKVHPMFNIRFDVRQYVTGKPFDLPGASGALRQMEVSVGFGLIM